MLICRECHGKEQRLVQRGVSAWICPRCERVSLRITDWNLWKRLQRVLPDLPIKRRTYQHIPTKFYVLRRTPHETALPTVPAQSVSHPSRQGGDD